MPKPMLTIMHYVMWEVGPLGGVHSVRVQDQRRGSVAVYSIGRIIETRNELPEWMRDKEDRAQRGLALGALRMYLTEHTFK